MPQFLRIPKVQLLITLLFIASSALIHNPSWRNSIFILNAVLATVFFDLLFTFLRKRTLFIPYAAIVSGLIIGLLINPQASWFQIAVACAFAMGGKNFLRISGKHMFNPAAFGLVFSALLLHQTVVWWGSSFQVLTPHPTLLQILFFFILLLPILVSGYRMRRYASIVSFLVSYSIIVPFVVSRVLSLASFLAAILDPTVIFFSIVMIPEPMTSPLNLKRQILYGFVVTLLVMLLSFLQRLLPDVLLPALLIANGIFFRFR